MRDERNPDHDAGTPPEPKAALNQETKYPDQQIQKQGRAG
jgi:hypothetical protein